MQNLSQESLSFDGVPITSAFAVFLSTGWREEDSSYSGGVEARVWPSCMAPIKVESATNFLT